MKACFSLLGLFFLGCVCVQAGEYHVSVNGNDESNGSLKHPFKTIAAAHRVARAGDIITVHEGTYREWVDPRFWF